MPGQSTTTLPLTSVLTHVLGENNETTGRQAIADLAAQLAARPEFAALNDALEARLAAAEGDIDALDDATNYASILRATWTDLAALSGTAEGQRAEVDNSDSGTHGAATGTGYDGATVDNAGTYSWNATWSRWVRIGDTGLAGLQADLDLKADAADIPDFDEDGSAESVPQAPTGQTHLNDTWINPRLSHAIRDIYRQKPFIQTFTETLSMRDMIIRAQSEARIPYSGTILYCDPTATGTDDGSSWTNAFTTLNAVFTAAGEGDIIRLNASEANPFAGQTVNWGGGSKSRIHIQCDRGADGMTVIDNRLFGTWTDEGGGIYSLEASYEGHAAFDFKQDDEAGTVTGCDWTRPSYKTHRLAFRRTVEQVAAWYGLLDEESSATTTPGEGKYSHTGGRYYINPPGSPDLATVNSLACVPGNIHALGIPHLSNCYWSGRSKVIFAPNPTGGEGYGASLNGNNTTFADMETICTGYHAVGFAGSSTTGNRMVNLTANGTVANKVAGTANAYVFYSGNVSTQQADCKAVGCYSVHYPGLTGDGTPIYETDAYAPNHGLSHGSGGVDGLFAGVRWSNCGQVDFVNQISRASGVGRHAEGSFVNGNDVGETHDVDDPNEWLTVCEDCWVLGAAARPSSATDHYNCIFDRDNLGETPPKNNYFINAASGATGDKRFRLRGGKLTTGAIGTGSYFGPTRIGDQMHLENVELVLEDGHFITSSTHDPANPTLRMGGCVVKSKVFNTAPFLQTTTAFSEGPGANFRSLGGNVFGAMGFIQVRGGYPIIASYEQDNQTFIDGVDPAQADIIEAPLLRFSEGPELLTNGDFATGDLTGWTVDSGWYYDDDGEGPSARTPYSGVANMFQAFACEEEDLMQIRFNLVLRSSAASITTTLRNAANDATVAFGNLTSQQAPTREYVYRVRADNDLGGIRFLKSSSPDGTVRIRGVSVKKLTIL